MVNGLWCLAVTLGSFNGASRLSVRLRNASDSLILLFWTTRRGFFIHTRWCCLLVNLPWPERACRLNFRAVRGFPPGLGEAQRATLKEAVQGLPEAAGIGLANWNWKGVH